VGTETDKQNRLVKEDVGRDIGETVVSENKAKGIVQVEDPVEAVGVGDGTIGEHIGFVMDRQRREPKPLHRLLESREYLARERMARRVPGAFAVTIGGVKVPQNFHEAIKDPDSWWVPIVKVSQKVTYLFVMN